MEDPVKFPDISPAELDALKAEVQKWQERVPKLASALRERTEEVSALREQLRTARATPEAVGAEDLDRRLKARDEHITELEAQVEALTRSSRASSGELHTLKLTLADAEQDATKWRQKWQQANESLDSEAASASTLKQEYQQRAEAWNAEKEGLLRDHAAQQGQLDKDVESLRRRNAQLAETTDLANKQLAALGDELQTLLSQSQEAEARIDALTAELEDVRQQGARALADAQQSSQAELQQALQQAERQAQQRSEEALEQVALAHEAELKARDAAAAASTAALETRLAEAEADARDRAAELTTQVDSLSEQLATLHERRTAELRAWEQQKDALEETATACREATR